MYSFILSKEAPINVPLGTVPSVSMPAPQGAAFGRSIRCRSFAHEVTTGRSWLLRINLAKPAPFGATGPAGTYYCVFHLCQGDGSFRHLAVTTGNRPLDTSRETHLSWCLYRHVGLISVSLVIVCIFTNIEKMLTITIGFM